MIRRLAFLLAAIVGTAAAPLRAQPTAPPKLIVAISVDQFSADLFAEYRGRWTGGMKRLAGGVVFPSGYQSHAATETCPGHSTILTGDHPSRTGIIANNWIDQTTRPGSQVYCAEDETVPGSTFRAYTPSVAHLLVPTLGDRMKAANPASRVVAVAGKDRAAIMLGGHRTDQIWFLDPFRKRSFVTLATQTAPAPTEVARLNLALDRDIGRLAPAQRLPPQCAAYDRAIALNRSVTVGAGRFERKANDADAFRASPALDAVTLTLATDLVRSMKLGQSTSPDLLALGLSATDYVGHRFGTEGAEMCTQLTALDAGLDKFFRALDRTGVDYLVVLTADHGGHDAPERNRERALPDAQRTPVDFTFDRLDAQLRREFGIDRKLVYSAELGDVWLDRALTSTQRRTIGARAKASLLQQPQVEAVFTAEEVEATRPSTLPPERWSLIERVRASYHKGRSGDLAVVLKERVTPIPVATSAYVATHGSPYDYDRRVPILFWRRGLAPFEQPNSVETVDIAPTLVAMLGLAIPAGDMDGRCLDLDGGSGSTCRLVEVRP